jgi:hypothetical protein
MKTEPAPPRAKQKTAASLSRHRRKCAVCRHPQRDAIEDDYLHWRSPDQIAANYRIADQSSIYRHAHATGLLARRHGHVRWALAGIIERASLTEPRARDIVAAVEVYARINDAGQWINSPRRLSAASEISPLSESEPPLSGLPNPNRQTGQVEHDPTH